MNDFEVVKRMCHKYNYCEEAGCPFENDVDCSIIGSPYLYDLPELAERLEKAREMLQEEM